MQHFTGLEDVREYLSGRRIQCLVCGRWFKRLQFMHLNLHNLTADGYRERFGIPWSYSLTSEPSREASRARITEANLRNLHLTKHVGGRKGDVHRKACLAVARALGAVGRVGPGRQRPPSGDSALQRRMRDDVGNHRSDGGPADPLRQLRQSLGPLPTQPVRAKKGRLDVSLAGRPCQRTRLVAPLLPGG